MGDANELGAGMRVVAMDDLIRKGKALLERRWKPEYIWHEATFSLDGGKADKVRVFVLDGDQAKGFVIANYGRAIVDVYNSRGDKVRVFRR
ncbi:MAG: hypothetical protein E3K36_04330 [Candidatus Brocadia sp.]|nr:hypothetical protein [Candidatus Brocadia sp.]